METENKTDGPGAQVLVNMRKEQRHGDESHHVAVSSCEILSLPSACHNNNLLKQVVFLLL